MKVCIDSGLPLSLRRYLDRQHVAYTYRYLGWQDLTNGELLEAARMAAFDVIITKDANMRHQQNLQTWGLALIVLRPTTESRQAFEALMEEASRALRTIRPGDVVELGERAGT